MIHNRQKTITGVYVKDHDIVNVFYGSDLVWCNRDASEMFILGSPSMNNGDTAKYRIRYIMPDASTYEMTATNAASVLPDQNGKVLYVTSKIDGSTPITINATVLRKDGVELHDTKEVTVNFLPLIDEFTIADTTVTQFDDIMYMPFVFNPSPRGDYSVTDVSLGTNQYVSVYSYDDNGIYIQRTGTIDKTSSDTVNLSVELTDELGETHSATASMTIKYLIKFFEIRNSKSANNLTVTFNLQGLPKFDMYADVDDSSIYPENEDYEHVSYVNSNNMPDTWVKTVPPGKSLYLYSDEMEAYYFNNSTPVSRISLSEDVEFAGDIMGLLKDNVFSTNYHEAFRYLFYNNTKITTAPALPATTLDNGCYDCMFQGCTALTTAPTLPAIYLSDECYESMFSGCTALTTAPTLPATTLAGGCYAAMFSGCTSLTTAPALPATTMEIGCYYRMFYGCTSLTTAPVLPSTTLYSGCYESMFEGCTALTTAPELPATVMHWECYESMFEGCTALTTAPVLPGTTMNYMCYDSMFKGCTALTTAPALPATILTEGDFCYSGMFAGCTSLTTAPALPATELEVGCYAGMFEGCTSLTTAPALPATELADRCYIAMFKGCTSLTASPVLPAIYLESSESYNNMFEDCTNLNWVEAHFNDTSQHIAGNTVAWLFNVASTGTFYKNPNLNVESLPSYCIPENWTITNYQEQR